MAGPDATKARGQCVYPIASDCSSVFQAEELKRQGTAAYAQQDGCSKMAVLIGWKWNIVEWCDNTTADYGRLLKHVSDSLCRFVSIGITASFAEEYLICNNSVGHWCLPYDFNLIWYMMVSFLSLMPVCKGKWQGLGSCGRTLHSCHWVVSSDVKLGAMIPEISLLPTWKWTKRQRILGLAIPYTIPKSEDTVNPLILI